MRMSPILVNLHEMDKDVITAADRSQDELQSPLDRIYIHHLQKASSRFRVLTTECEAAGHDEPTSKELEAHDAALVESIIAEITVSLRLRKHLSESYR